MSADTEAEADTEAKTFDTLSEKTQQAVYERYRNWWVLDEWWESTYEDAKRMAELLGIEIEHIYFRGFWSQGDGACFTGSYSVRPDAIAAIQSECNDETLLDFAQRLTAVAVAVELSDIESWKVKIGTNTNSHYNHSGTMSLEVEAFDLRGYTELPEGTEPELLACMREFADWIYKNLEAEHDHLTSDEYIRERFVGDGSKFDEDGAMI